MRFGRFHGNEIFIVRLIFWLCSVSVFLSQVLSFIIKTLSHTLLFQTHIKTSNYQTPRRFHLEASTMARGAPYAKKKNPPFSARSDRRPRGAVTTRSFLIHTLQGRRKTASLEKLIVQVNAWLVEESTDDSVVSEWRQLVVQSSPLSEMKYSKATDTCQAAVIHTNTHMHSTIMRIRFEKSCFHSAGFLNPYQ